MTLRCCVVTAVGAVPGGAWGGGGARGLLGDAATGPRHRLQEHVGGGDSAEEGSQAG